MTDLSGAGVRLILIGTATHHGSTLPPVPAARRSVLALERWLIDRCDVAAHRLRVMLDPPDARTMAAAIAEEAQRAETVMLVYYVGHGLIGPGGELHLAATGTDDLVPGLAAHQALSVTAVREALGACPADAVVLVLDCCFSGRAGIDGRVPEPVFALPPVHGGYLLASAEQLALASPEQEYTTFSGALIRLLAEGDPRGPRRLTLDDVYEYLERTLSAEGAPLPRRQASDRAGSLVFAPNAAQPAPRSPVLEPDHTDGRCPYVGLASFGVEDAALFRGRESLVDELLDAAARSLATARPLLLVGASGAGKSSLLHAGLLARLRAGAPGLPGSAGWPSIVFTPGEQPVQALLTKLTSTGTTDPELLREDPSRAPQFVRDLLAGRGSDRLVLVVDQLEQLFVACPDRRERTDFLRMIASLAGSTSSDVGQVLVVLALRADFYGHAAAHPELVDALRENQLLVGPMSLAELRAAIEEPAAAVGLRLDDGLADLILHELGATGTTGPHAGTLPLLSYAMWATWLRRSGSRLTVAGYRESGGIAHAIATTADRAYADLDPAGRQAVRRMLPRLVHVDDELNDTARPVDIDTLRRGLPEAAVAQALRRFTEARLLTLDRDTARLAHEVLLHAWPLLREWIDADREWLRAHQRLRADVHTWLRTGRDPSLLYRGSRLAAVSERASEATRAGELAPEVADFLARSTLQQRRGVRLRRTVIAGLVVLLMLATVGGVTAVTFQRQTEAERTVAVARLVASQAEDLRARDPRLAKQLSLVSYQLDPESGTGPVLASQRSPGVFNPYESAVDLALPEDGPLLAISTGAAIALWDTEAGDQWGRIDGLVTGPVAVSTDGRILAAGVGQADPSGLNLEPPARDQVRLWDVADPANPVAAEVLQPGAGEITTLAIDPDSQLLVAGSARGDIRVWDIGDPHAVRLTAAFSGHEGGVDTVTFAPVDRLLASSGPDKMVRLWDLTDPAQPSGLSTIPGSGKSKASRFLPGDIVHRLAFNSDGSRLATVTEVDSGEEFRTWDITDPARPRPTGAPDDGIGGAHCGYINSIDINQTSSLLASTCDLERLHLWWPVPSQPKDGNLVLAANVSTPTRGPAMFHHSARRLLQASESGARLWDITNPWRPGARSSLPDSVGGFGAVVAFNPVGPRLLAHNGAFRTLVYNVDDVDQPRFLATYEPGSHLGGNGVDFAPAGNIMAVSEAEEDQVVVRLRNTDDPAAGPVATISDLANGVTALRFSPDQRTLAVVDNSDHLPSRTGDPAIRLYDVRDPSQPSVLATVPGEVRDLAFSPDGRLLTGYADDAVVAWDVSDPRHPTTRFTLPLTPGSTVSKGEFSPDGRLLAVGDSTSTLRVWPIADGEPFGEPLVVPGGLALAFSPDGRTLAVGEEAPAESSIVLWRVDEAGSLSRQARLTIDPVDSLAFSPDGAVLAAASAGSVDLWDTDPERVAGNLCRTAGDPISREEWAQYVPGMPYEPPCR